MSWSTVSGASGYTVYRRVAGGSFASVGTTTSTSFNDTSAATNTAYLYRVRATNDTGASPDSVADFATTLTFTDPTLSAGVTTCKAAHVTELRTAVNALEALAGIANTAYTDGSLTSVGIRTVHIDELRTRLAAARTLLGAAALSLTDATLTAGTTPVKLAHVSELRAGVQ